MSVVQMVLWGFVALLGARVATTRGPVAVRRAGRFALGQAGQLIIRLPLALLAASFLTEVLPAEQIGRIIGAESGFVGIVVASFLGGLMPGGPMVSFPIALVMWQMGAGPAQTVALLAGWSIFAFHRILAYEAPMMGWRFTALRLTSCFFLPMLSGLLAQGGILLAADFADWLDFGVPDTTAVQTPDLG